MTLFTHLRRFRKILVTGPQRAGTTIAAKMIAADTGHRYVDEDAILRDRLDLIAEILRSEDGVVVQCPALCRYAHELADEQTAVLLMRRAVADIAASQRRIGWKAERLELRRYGLNSGVIAQVKYDFWDTQQREHIRHAFEVDYESLSRHPLWIDKADRHNFRPRQTER